MVLTLLAILVAALVGLAIASVQVPRRVVALGSAGISALVVLLALAALLIGGEPAMLALPIGPAGGAVHLSLDPLGAGFLLLLFVAAMPCAMFAGAEQNTPASLAGFPGSLAAMALAVLAADAFTLATALGTLGIAGWLLLSPGQETDEAGDIGRSYLGFAAVSAVSLIAAVALMAPASIGWLDCDYAAIRAAPPEGWRALGVLVLTLLAASGLIGLAPMHFLVPRLGNVSALLIGTGAGIGLYLLFRVLLDLSGPAQALWWGVPLLVLGTASAMLGSLWATFETRLEPALTVGSLQQSGLAVTALGVALLARAADLPQVGVLALEASWLLLVTHVLCRTLLLLCAAAVLHGAGTRRLDRLGGLIHRMPFTVICALAGLFAVAMVPPGLGFAGLWLLFQSLLAVSRIGSLDLQLMIVLIVALVVLSAGLSAVAAVRLAGVAFLGRPRTPRTAVAEEVPRARRLCLIGLAAFSGLLGALPGLAVVPVARGLAHLANGSGLDMAVVLRPGTEAAGYDPLAIIALLAVACGIMIWLSRRRGPKHRRESAWSGGFAPPPQWLPFGDPATQTGAASFAAPLLRVLGPWSLLLKTWGRIEAPLARLRGLLCGAAEALGQPSLSGSIAVTLALLSLGIVFWLAAS